MFTRDIPTEGTEWFIALGDDRDYDGGSLYACAVTSDRFEDARDEWGNSMTADGFFAIVTPPEAALEYGVNVRDLLNRRDSQGAYFRYETVRTWLTAIGRDDSVGTILDHTYDEPIYNDDDLEMMR